MNIPGWTAPINQIGPGSYLNSRWTSQVIELDVDLELNETYTKVENLDAGYYELTF